MKIKAYAAIAPNAELIPYEYEAGHFRLKKWKLKWIFAVFAIQTFR